MPGTVERVSRFKWPGATGEVNPNLKRSYVWEAETVRRAILDAVWRIAQNGVTRECLADGAVSESKFAAALVPDLSRQDGSVTVQKLGDGCLTADATGRLKVEDLFATGAKFADRTITAACLATAVGAYAIPAGTMLWFAGETAPYGWLECNGQEQLVSTYPALAAACGTLWGTPAGGALYFKLPDFRGYFERGWAHEATTDPDKATRAGGDHVGSTQANQVKAHTHEMHTLYFLSGTPTAVRPYMTSTNPYVIETEMTGGQESRPKNVSLMKIVKW